MRWIKNLTSSRVKLLCHTLSLSWPKLLSPISNKCYQFSIRHNRPNPTSVVQISQIKNNFLHCQIFILYSVALFLSKNRKKYKYKLFRRRFALSEYLRVVTLIYI